MSWIINEVESGRVSAINTNYNAKVRIYNSPTTSYYSVIIMDDEHGVELSIYTDSSRKNSTILKMFDKPEWVENPWALSLAFSSPFSYRHALDIQRTLFNNYSYFNADEDALKAWYEALKNNEELTYNRGYHFWTWAYITIKPLSEILLKMFRGAKYSLSRAEGWGKREKVTTFMFAGEHLMKFVEDKPDLHNELTKTISYIISKGL